MENIYLDVTADGNLVISQKRLDEPRGSSVILTPAQVTALVDTLLGPNRVKTVTVDLGKLIPESENKPN